MPMLGYLTADYLDLADYAQIMATGLTALFEEI